MSTTTVTLKKAKRPPPKGGTNARYVWQLRWHGVNGKNYCKTLGPVGTVTQREAERARRDLQGKLDQNAIPRDRPKRITFAELVAYDAQLVVDRRPKTQLVHVAVVKRASKVFGATTKVDQITRSHVAHLKARMQADGYRDASIDQTIRVLRAMWNRAKVEYLVTDNPFAGNGVRWDPKPSRIFSAEEISTMIEVAPTDWWRLFLRVVSSTGLRKLEALHLRWQDLNLFSGTLTICRHDAGQVEIEGTTYPLLAWTAKAKASYRTIPMDEDLVGQLGQARAKALSPYVFVDLNRLAKLGAKLRAGTLSAIYEPVNNILRDLRVIQAHARALLAERRKVNLGSVDWPIGCVHDLRDSYITHLKHHVSADVLQRVAGHADIATTMKYYATDVPQDADVVRAAISACGLSGGSSGRNSGRAEGADPTKTRTDSAAVVEKPTSRYDNAALSA